MREQGSQKLVVEQDHQSMQICSGYTALSRCQRWTSPLLNHTATLLAKPTPRCINVEDNVSEGRTWVRPQCSILCTAGPGDGRRYLHCFLIMLVTRFRPLLHRWRFTVPATRSARSVDITPVCCIGWITPGIAKIFSCCRYCMR